MGSGNVTRWLVLVSAASWPLVLDAAGCATGDTEVGNISETEGDAALANVATDREGGANDGSGAASDAQGSLDATSADDAQTSADAPSVLDGAPSDASAAGDAVPDAPSSSDGSLADATTTPTRDASSDAPTEIVDTGPPVDATSCTSTCGAQALCISGLCVASRRVFVSTESFTGNLGGTSGADHSCQSLANAAQLGGTWMAWVSDSTTSPSTRFTQATVGYRLLDGTLLAADWASLVSSTLLHDIDLTEQRTSATNAQVWTGTLSTGVAIGADVCGGFTSSANGAAAAVVGNTSQTDIGWSNATSDQCDSNNLRIYCMEQ